MDVFYTKTHEWVSVDENCATVGITEYAKEQLGEIVYLSLPEEGHKVSQDESFGCLESVKAASDLISPVSGTVVEINSQALEEPGVINENCMGEGWLIKVEMDSEKELAHLLKEQEYQNFTKENEK